jgi:phosphopentomutase
MQKLHTVMAEQKCGLIFTNLVDFDMLYGHRKDVEGFAKSLEEFDVLLAPLLRSMAPRDLLILTADHGCDPDPAWPTTDHSREYVPIVTYSPAGKRGVNIGVRDTLADMGQTIADNFGAEIPHGKSFLPEIANS